MLMHKATTAEPNGNTFVLSDNSVDRYGDVIEPSGWRLTEFKKNPIALFGHDSSHPIGVWENVRVEGNRLLGDLKLAVEGTSQRIDEIRRLVEQKILKAVSVGFRPLKAEPLEGGKGYRYVDQELLETSVVSIPANPNAVSLAKSLNISDETLSLVFGKDAIHTRGAESQGQAGPSSSSSTPNTGTGKMNIQERIAAARQRMTDLQTRLRSAVEAWGDEPTQDQLTEQARLNGEILNTQTQLRNLEATERALMGTAQAAGTETAGAAGAAEGGAAQQGGSTQAVERSATGGAQFGAGQGEHQNLGRSGTVWAAPATQVKPVDHVFRALAVMVKNHDQKVAPVETLRTEYGENNISTQTKAIMDVVLRAASAPADTVTPAWAGALVQTAVGEFINLLLPQSIYPGLRDRGGRFTFGRNGKISLPSRSATPSIAGAFVGEGAPIPVRQAGFSSVALTPKKMAVITTMTREIMEASTPALEGILRQAIQEDTSTTLDSILIDATAASAIRPAGIRAGVGETAGSGAATFEGMVADIKALVGALIASTAGNLRAPVWVMNPVRALSVQLAQNGAGEFPFQAEIAAGRLVGFPVLQSATVPADMLILVDAADFFSATGDDPRFDVSDQAVLHMEDTAPAQLGTVGAPATIAAPARSLWQTDTIGLRMIMPINWAMRRAGVVSWMDGLTW